MKQKWRIVVACVMTMLTILGAIGFGAGEVKAASSSARLQLWYASAREHGAVSEFNSSYTGNILYAMIDGHVAYCMNYAKSADGSQQMTSSSRPKTSLTAAQEKQLSYCLYYGYSSTTVASPSTSQRNQFIATQAMVWIIEKNLFGTEKGDSAARKLCNCAPGPDEAYSYYTSLKNKMHASYYVVVPSFASTTQSGASTYELKWSEENQRYETNLIDTKGALSNFDFSLSGYSMSKSGNQLTIYTSQANTTSAVAKATAKNGAVEPKSTCVYWQINKDRYQEFISTRPQVDPVSAYIKVKTESIGYGKVVKKDENTGAPLSGAVFGIYSDRECSTFVTTLTTGEDGTATSQALTSGTYYAKEIKAPEGYLLDDRVHTVLIEAGKTSTFEATNQEPKGRLLVYKEGEVLVGWNGTDFVYEMRGLAGAEFSVYANEELVEVLVTGEDGKAELNNLPLGTYRVVETKAPNGYVLNGNEQTVTLAYQDEHTPVIESEITFGNDRQRIQLHVKKMDIKSKEGLAGAKFGLYAKEDIYSVDGTLLVSAGTLIEEAVSDEHGEVRFQKDYPFAMYVVKEQEAPKGYLLNEEEIVFDVIYEEPEKEMAEYYKEVFNAPEEVPDIPKTGDTKRVGLWFGKVAVSLICISLFVIRKRKKKEE